MTRHGPKIFPKVPPLTCLTPSKSIALEYSRGPTTASVLSLLSARLFQQKQTR